MRHTESYTVKHFGIAFTVSGEWENYIPATRDEPEEGGCFYEYEITVDELEGENVFTELLSVEVIQKLVMDAEAGIKAL